VAPAVRRFALAVIQKLWAIIARKTELVLELSSLLTETRGSDESEEFPAMTTRLSKIRI
jgi:hypothetical protein